MIKSRYTDYKPAKPVSEVLVEYEGKYDALEIYRVENIPNVLWCEAEFIGFSALEAGDNAENEVTREVYLYSEQEYNKVFNEDVDFNYMYGSSDARVLCLCLWKSPKYPVEGIIGYKRDREYDTWVPVKEGE